MSVATARKSETEIAQARQKIYAVQRMPLIKEEMQSLSTEHKDLRSAVKTVDEAKKKNIRRRQVYVIERLAALKKEMASLRPSPKK
jgi:hypothetical protein